MQNFHTVYVFDKNKDSREIIKSYLQDVDFIKEVKLYDNFNKGCEEIKNENNPIVILDISDISSSIEETATKIKLYTSKIIISSMDYSTDTIVKALRYGAKKILPKPIIKNDLLRILKILSNESEPKNSAQSKIITIYSNKGGIGKTTVAVNLAAEIAKTTKEKVALIDLNLQIGDISTFLNLNPPFDVSYVINKFLDKDETTLIQGFEKYKNLPLYVLADPTYIEQAESITEQKVDSLFSVLKKVFSYIIVDMSSNIDPVSLKILDKSDWILFTTIVNIPAIRNAQRCLNLFKSRNYPDDKIKIIVNRYIENDELNIQDIEKTLDKSIYWKIPNNYFTIMEAINKGMCVSEVNANSNIGNNFRDFAIKVTDDIIEHSVMQYKIK